MTQKVHNIDDFKDQKVHDIDDPIHYLNNLIPSIRLNDKGGRKWNKKSEKTQFNAI